MAWFLIRSRNARGKSACVWRWRQAKDVLRLVLGQGLFVIGLGLAAGLSLAFAATRLIAGFLYGVGQPICDVWLRAALLSIVRGGFLHTGTTGD